MKTRIILLSGTPASGKTTVAKYLEREHGASLIDVGNVLYDHIKSKELLCNTRGSIGPNFLNHYSIDDIFNVLSSFVLENDTTVFDAIRFIRTFKQFAQWNKHITLWCVETDNQIRKRRRVTDLSQRGWNNIEIQKEWARYCLYDDYMELRRHADVIFNNNGTYNDLYSQVHDLSEKFFFGDSR